MEKQEDKSVTKEKSHGNWYHNLTIVIFALSITLFVPFSPSMSKDMTLTLFSMQKKKKP